MTAAVPIPKTLMHHADYVAACYGVLPHHAVASAAEFDANLLTHAIVPCGNCCAESQLAKRRPPTPAATHYADEYGNTLPCPPGNCVAAGMDNYRLPATPLPPCRKCDQPSGWQRWGGVCETCAADPPDQPPPTPDHQPTASGEVAELVHQAAAQLGNAADLAASVHDNDIARALDSVREELFRLAPSPNP